MDPDELAIFETLAEIWWTDKGWTLRSMNGLRIPYVIERLESVGFIKMELTEADRPLSGISILDVGCGGGFASEDLAEIGAEVTGIDGCPELIEVAKMHLLQEGKLLPNLKYHAETIQDFAEKSNEQYDVVLAFELMDHVTDKNGIVIAMSKCLKSGGSIFVSTMNKCFLSWVFCKVIPEYICRFIPIGLHEYKKFISVEDMRKLLDSNKCVTKDIRGMYYNHFRGYWFWLNTTSTLYIMHAVKTPNI